MNNEKEIKIVLSGGGTGGSVAPLLAIADELIEKQGKDNFSFFWVGTENGVERTMIQDYPFEYKVIAAGKLRRYFSWENILDIGNVIVGFFQSLSFLLTVKPNLVITAGSFVSVPLAWAARLLDISLLVHQQDIVPGLANRLMAPGAKTITVTFEKSLKDFGAKAVWTGNPIRKEFKEVFASSTTDKATVLIIGGGTGSEMINNLVAGSVSDLVKVCQLIHITGAEHSSNESSDNFWTPHDNYQRHQFLNAKETAQAMSQADIVICRGGLGTLTELSYLAKPAIIIPMSNSHQEDNATYFSSRGAALVLEQMSLTPGILVETIKSLLENKEKLESMSINMKKSMKEGANEKISQIIKDLIRL